MVYNRNTVIIEFGTALTKIGTPDEPTPSAVLHTPFLRSHYKIRNGECTLDEKQWHSLVLNFLYYVFHDIVKLNPKESQVVLLEGATTSLPFREAVSRILFHSLQCPCVAYINEMCTPMYLSTKETCLVVDVGYKSSRVLPVFAAIPCHHAHLTTPLAGETVNRILKRLVLRDTLKELTHNKDSALAAPILAVWGGDTKKYFSQLLDKMSNHVVESIKVRSCFVRHTRSSINQDNSDKEKKESIKKVEIPSDGYCGTMMKYFVDNDLYVLISPTTRWQATEVLFHSSKIYEDSKQWSSVVSDVESDISYETALKDVENGEMLVGSCEDNTGESEDDIVDAIIDCIRNTEIDIRKRIVGNITLCGGTVDFFGFMERIAHELKSRLSSNAEVKSLVSSVRFNASKFSGMIRQLVGAAIWGSVEGSTNYLSASDYRSGASLPDWLDPK